MRPDFEAKQHLVVVKIPLNQIFNITTFFGFVPFAKGGECRSLRHHCDCGCTGGIGGITCAAAAAAPPPPRAFLQFLREMHSIATLLCIARNQAGLAVCVPNANKHIVPRCCVPI